MYRLDAEEWIHAPVRAAVDNNNDSNKHWATGRLLDENDRILFLDMSKFSVLNIN